MKARKVIFLGTAITILPLTFSYSQTFTKITQGVVVNDSSYSWGSSWADYDNDGDLDLFVSNLDGENPKDNRLYRNNGNGTFTRITEGEIVNDGGGSFSSSWGDYDNDGDIDLFVPNIYAGFFARPNNTLYTNNGDGTFARVSEGITIDARGSTCVSWGDYDNDGYVDLFIATALDENLLYRNNADGTFSAISQGIIVEDEISSRGCNWADIDNDGDLDLFVVNRSPSEGNFLYRNDGNGSFHKVSDGPVVSDIGASNGGSFGDYDNDGDLDLFVANRVGKNNILYTNTGNGTFAKTNNGAIVADSSLSLSSSWGDYDNDGYLDLFVANFGSNNFLYANNGDGTFSKITEGAIVNDGGGSSGSTWADFDHDGDLDLFVSNENGENNFLYANNGNTNHWINIRCLGTVSNKSAIGTRVRIKAQIDGELVWQMREISGQTGFGGQNSLNAEFGLGNATAVDSIVVSWPASGIIDIFTNIAADQFLTATEGQGLTSIKDRGDLPLKFELHQNYPNPFNPSTTISYSLSNSGHVTLKVYDILAREVATLTDVIQTTGNYKEQFDAKGLSAGVYFYTLQVGKFVEVKKMIFLR